MRKRPERPIWPAYATAQEAVRYLASACDGAIRRDGHGFSAEHVPYGHWLANLEDEAWGHVERAWGLHLVRIYRQQLTRAGFDPNAILRGRKPRKIKRRAAAKLQPGWASDPAGLHVWRWWNGARWTAVTASPSPSDNTDER